MTKRQNMIYNKELGITTDDIAQEVDLGTLCQWKRSTDIQITELLKNVDGIRMLSKKGQTLYKCLFTFKKLLNARIAEIKTTTGYRSERSLRKDRTLSMLFQKKAKEMLDKEVYEMILNAAKEEITG